MLEIKKTSKLSAIKDDWNRIYSENDGLICNASYEFVSKMTNGIISKLKRFIKHEKLSFFYFVENGTVRMILPLVEQKDVLRSLYTLDYFDIVVDKNLDGKGIVNYLNALSSQENKKIVIERLNKQFDCYKKLDGLVNLEKFSECVKIDFSSDYNAYYNSLSKHARQNLRTAYNRIEKDSIDCSFKIFWGKIDKRLSKSLKKIYLDRRVTRYNNMKFAKKLLYSLSEPISKVCFEIDNAFTSVLYFNNKPVSFMSGHISGQQIIIPRLAIHKNYEKYSTGIVLINETIKQIQTKNFTCLDLASGTEQYKYQMGGVSHFNYSFEIGDKNEEAD